MFASGMVAKAASSSDAGEIVLTLLLYPLSVLSLLAVGAMLVARVPENRVGAVILAAGVISTVGITCGAYATVGWNRPGEPWPGTVLAALLDQLLSIYPLVLTLVIAPLHFPDGRLPGPRWRAVLVLAALALAASTVADLFRPTTLVAGIPNPFGTPAAVPLVDALGTFMSAAAIVGFGAAAAAILVRFRRSSGIQRQQLKWLMAVAGVAAIVVPGSFLAPTAELGIILYIGDLLLFAGVPITIGLAILRYRLYEIDRIVSRVIGWGVMTLVLGAVFAGGIVGLQAVVAPLTDNNTFAVAASTLLAATLFQPLRQRVQRAVDRRFDRSRHDGEQVVRAFTIHVRDEVDLVRLRSALVRATGDAIRPASTAIWLRGGDR